MFSLAGSPLLRLCEFFNKISCEARSESIKVDVSGGECKYMACGDPTISKCAYLTRGVTEFLT